MSPKDFSERGLVEKPTLAMLEQLGYEIGDGYTEHFGAEHVQQGGIGRDDQSQVVLQHRLRPKLAELNRDLPQTALDAALDELTRDRSTMEPTRANEEVWRLLRDGAKVTVTDDEPGSPRPSPSSTGAPRSTTTSSRSASYGSSARCTPVAPTSSASSTESRSCCSS